MTLTDKCSELRNRRRIKMKINFDRKYSVNFIAPRADNGTHGWVVVLGACLVFVRKSADHSNCD